MQYFQAERKSIRGGEGGRGWSNAIRNESAGSIRSRGSLTRGVDPFQLSVSLIRLIRPCSRLIAGRWRTGRWRISRWRIGRWGAGRWRMVTGDRLNLVRIRSGSPRFVSVDRGFVSVDRGFASVDRGFASVRREFAGGWPGDGREMAGRWTGDGREMAGRWTGDGREMDGVWPGDGRGLAGRWTGFGREMDGVWPGVRRGSAPFVRFRLGVREPGMANWKMDNWSKILSKMG